MPRPNDPTKGQTVTEAVAEQEAAEIDPVTAAARREAERRKDSSRALALTSDQEFFTPSQIAALWQLGIKGATPPDLAVYLHVCKQTQLDPFSRQIHMIKRRVWNIDTREYEDRWTIQTGISGYQVIRDRAARRDGVTVEYEDTIWYGKDGVERYVWLADEPPYAARVVVLKDGRRFPGVVLWREVAALDKDGKPQSEWKHQPAHMLEKCFAADTEVLTEHGFRRFPDVDGARIAQVTDHGLEFIAAAPFAQRYDGPMVAVHGERLNFAVTPDHDMITTAGRVEAQVLLRTARTRPQWRIPLTAPGRQRRLDEFMDSQLALAGYFLADGSAQGNRLLISVSKPRKIAALDRLGLHYRTQVKRDAGRVSGGIRPVTTRSDKTTFVYHANWLDGLIGPAKHMDPDLVLRLSQAQARTLLDAWAEFDGSRPRAGTMRLTTSNTDHVGLIELLAVAAGYTVSAPRKRVSDISERPSYVITLSATRQAAPVTRPQIHAEPNQDGWVWCVTVPSHKIIVRRNGFAMVCGQCAEAFALRRAFPNDLSGLYTDEEMARFDEPPEPARRPSRRGKAEKARTEPQGDGRLLDGTVLPDPGDPPASERPKNDRQRMTDRMHALCDELGLGGKNMRDARLAALAFLRSRSEISNPANVKPLGSSSELEDDDLAYCVTQLAKIKDMFDKTEPRPSEAEIRREIMKLPAAGGWQEAEEHAGA